MNLSKIAQKTALLLLVPALLVQVHLHAAKGGVKDKKGVLLKFAGFEYKSLFQSYFHMLPGFDYRNSFNEVKTAPMQTTIQSIITYQKGNSTFIYPYQHKVSVPKFKTPEPMK